VPKRPGTVAGVGDRGGGHHRDGLGRERAKLGHQEREVEHADVDDEGDGAHDTKLHQLPGQGVQPVVDA
jgi:hypothetical protein